MTDPMQVHKLGGRFPVSAEAFATTPLHLSVDIDAATAEVIADLFSTDPDVIARRAERNAAARAEADRLNAERNAAADVRYDAVLARLTDPVARAVAEHHAPTDTFGSPTCAVGCGDDSPWPCDTWDVIEGNLP